MTSSVPASFRAAGVASDASSVRAAKPSRAASRLAPSANASLLPLSVANRIVSFCFAAGGAAATGACPASSPARKPESQARCVGVDCPITRLSCAIASGAKGALSGSLAAAVMQGSWYRDPR
jgi:hypothetical protein